MVEYDPGKGRLGFFNNDQQIVIDESHYHPMFIANDIEELRNNPEIRKVLKQFKIFTGVSQADSKDDTNHNKNSHNTASSNKQ
jgi:hypothetical protein